MDIYKDRIKPLFQKTGKTDADLEKEIGLPRSIIYKWETGVNKSYKKHCDLIAGYFGVSADYLPGRTDAKKPAALSDGLSEDEINVIKTYKKQTQEEIDKYEMLLVARGMEMEDYGDNKLFIGKDYKVTLVNLTDSNNFETYFCVLVTWDV